MSQSESGDQCGFAIFTRDTENGSPNTSPPIDLRLVNVPDEPPLPLTKDEWPALPYAARDCEAFNEGDDFIGSIRLPNRLV